MSSTPLYSPSYIPLRNHTPYSLLEGSIPIKTLLHRAESWQMPALGLADTGHLFGAMEFSLACQKAKIQPLIGVTLSVLMPEERAPSQMVFFAASLQGYQHLCHLVSVTTVGQPSEYRGILRWEQLEGYTQGLLVLTGGLSGPLDQSLFLGKKDQGFSHLKRLKEAFPACLYMELMRLEGLADDAESLEASSLREVDPLVTDQRLACEEQLINWALDEHIPLVATNPALFLTPEDHSAQDALRCIALGRYIQEQDRPRVSSYSYLRSPQEMEALFSDILEALHNTHHIAQRCHFFLKSLPPSLPSFPCQKKETGTLDAQKTWGEQEELQWQSQEGLKRRLELEVFPSLAPEDRPQREVVYKERLAYECDMIIRMGFAGYFLIVSDFIRWAKKQQIPVGPGRGSGASSLVAWSLSITDVDPIRFNLFFERFLNPERVSMPDFDVDFCQERRDEVIAYVKNTYGQDRVAHIITFGSLQARVVLRDVGRVLQMPYMQVDKICKLIPQNPANPISLKQALVLEPQLNAMAQEDENVQTLLDIGQKLEGLYRHASTHAAGVIISQGPLEKSVPLYQDEGSALPATEFSMKYVESAGLIKFDFLGLKTLTVLQTAVNLVAQRGVNIDLVNIPLDDRQSFALLCRAETVGLFQLESAGMTDVLRQLQPESFNEIIALVALYRPGPMDDIPRYIACRHGQEAISYAYPCLEDILKETFGVMVYQEQVLQIARLLAGYTMGGADLLRRAMGKKIKAEMDAQRRIFLEGVLKDYPHTEEKAGVLFDQIAKFAGYAFPKAHATPYALISYQTTYMKANYPVEFLAALMIHDAHNTDKLRIFIKEAQRMGISIAPPDINHSFSLFAVENEKTIRYGLAALKGVGIQVMEKIVHQREEGGAYRDIFDFIRRTWALGINKKNLESLICAGAFDGLHPQKRAQLMAGVDVILKVGSACTQQETLFTGSLFPTSAPKPTLKETPPWSSYESLEHERIAIGFYLSGHPLESYQGNHITLYEKVMTDAQEEERSITMMGMILDVVEKISKSGKKYAFVHLSDPTGAYEATAFSEVLSRSRPLLKPGTAVSLRVSVRQVGELVRMNIQEIAPLHHSQSEVMDLVIRTEQDISHLKTILDQATAGNTQLRCHLSLHFPREEGSGPALHYKVRALLPKSYSLTPSLSSALEFFTFPVNGSGAT